MRRELNGLLLIDKPEGVTSHDVVMAIRKAAGMRRVGHAGTLDPLATGLMLVCLGKATRVVRYLQAHDKAYYVEARLGAETDTYDAEGHVTRRSDRPLPDDAAIDRAMQTLLGLQEQVPPPFSAAKVAGKPLYSYARAGVEPPFGAKSRSVVVYSLRWERVDESVVAMWLRCSAGTYVRALVHKLGQELKCGAFVEELRRLSSGSFCVDQALPLSEWEDKLRRGDLRGLLSIERALEDMPVLNVDASALHAVKHGQDVRAHVPLDLRRMPHTVLDERGRVCAVVRYDDSKDCWHPEVVLATPNEGSN